MSREELIAMAREADPFGDDGRLVSLAMLTPGTLERFAALVAAREREACAQVCSFNPRPPFLTGDAFAFKVLWVQAFLPAVREPLSCARKCPL